MNKNIFFIMNGYSGTISGGDDHSIRFINYLSGQGWDVVVIKPADAYENLLVAGVKRKNIPLLPFESKLRKYNNLLFFIYLYRVVYSSIYLSLAKYNYLVCASHLFHDVVPLMFTSKQAKKVVYLYHLVSAFNNRVGISGALVKALENISIFIIKKVEPQVFTSSKYVSDILVDMFAGRSVAVYETSNGVDVNKLKLSHCKPEYSYDIVFCGRLVERKGLIDLIDAVYNLKKNNQDLSVAIIGSGPLYSALQERIKDLDLSRVEIHLSVDDIKKFSIIKSSKLFVLPSYEEGWGIVIGEALACGTPVVSYYHKEIHPIWSDAVKWCECGNIKQLENIIADSLNDRIRADDEFWIKKLDWNNILQFELDIVVGKNNFSIFHEEEY